MVTYSDPRVTYSDPKVTYSYPKVGQIILFPRTPNITKYPYLSNIPLVIFNYVCLTLQATNNENFNQL